MFSDASKKALIEAITKPNTLLQVMRMSDADRKTAIHTPSGSYPARLFPASVIDDFNTCPKRKRGGIDRRYRKAQSWDTICELARKMRDEL